MTKDAAFDALERALIQAIEGEVAQIREQLIKGAVAMFEREVRVALGRAAIDVTNYFSVQRQGPELVIRVQIEAKK